MKKIITILIITACIGLSSLLFAEERNALSPVVALSKEAKTKLKTVQTIAIFLNGNDSLLTRIVEDTLSISLTQAGLIVTSREILEKTVGEKMAKKRKAKTEGAVNALEIGKAVNADSIVTGTVIIKSGDQTLLVKIASFQLVDVSSGKILLSILFEPGKGNSFSAIARKFVAILKQSMK